jgi:hypothetical protein
MAGRQGLPAGPSGIFGVVMSGRVARITRKELLSLFAPRHSRRSRRKSVMRPAAFYGIIESSIWLEMNDAGWLG